MLELLEMCLCVSAVPEPNTHRGTIQTDKIMDEKGVENLSCILVAFLMAIALAALDRKAYPSQRAGKSSPAPTVTLKPVANIQRGGPSQWGVDGGYVTPGSPAIPRMGLGSRRCPSEPSAEYPGAFSPCRNHSTPGVKINIQGAQPSPSACVLLRLRVWVCCFLLESQVNLVLWRKMF